MQSLGRKIVNFLGMTTLGQKTKDNSLSVVVATDQVVNVSSTVVSGKGILLFDDIVTIGTPPAKLTSNTDGVKAIRIQNLGTEAIYLGSDDTVVSTTGYKLPENTEIYLPYISDEQEIWAKPATTGINVRTIEEI